MRPGPTRFRLFFVLAGLVTLALCLRLMDLQILHQETWARERVKNMLGDEFLSAPRGRILARHGEVLAEDRMRFELAIHYRYFRRQHPLALLLHFDVLSRWIHEEEPTSLLSKRLPKGLVSSEGRAQGLRYQDDLERFSEALNHWLAMPSSQLRRKGIRLQTALSSLRFYSFRLLSLAVEAPQADRFGRDYKISARFNGWGHEKDGLSILERFAPALTGLEGLEARNELRSRLGMVLRRGYAHLQHLDQLLSKQKIAPKTSIFQRLDFWQAIHDRFLNSWVMQMENKRKKREELKASEGIAAMLARLFLGEDRLETPDLESKIEKLYAIEDTPRPLFPGIAVSFDRIVALIVGKQEDYPGFRIQERYGRIYPQGTEETRYQANPYDQSLLNGLVPFILGPVRTVWARKPRGEQAIQNQAALKRPRINARQGQVEESAFNAYSGNLRDYAFKKGRLSRREGFTGLEGSLDGLLRGQGGLRSKTTDRLGHEVGMPNLDEAIPGRDLQLTLDWDLQVLAEQHLEKMARDLDFGLHDRETRHHASAALAMIDARTGDILCIASYPRARLDSNADPIRWQAEWRNYCLTTPARVGYIGSTIKPFLAVEGLMRFPDPLSLVEECKGRNGRRGSQGRFSYQNRSFSVSCNRHVLRGFAIHSNQGIENALQESCNAFFCQLSRLLGREGIVAGLRRFGLAGPAQKPDSIQGTWIQTPGIDEARWPLNRLGIGYGVKAAPLQVARAYAGLGTGRLPRLRIVDRIDDVVQASRSEDLNIPEAILSRVQRGLARVVMKGTGRGHRWLRRAEVAGKTGTAILMLDGGKVKRYRAWFSGYYPRRAPRFAFSCAFFGARDGGGKAAAKTMDAFLASLDSHARLVQYLPSFARSKRVR